MISHCIHAAGSGGDREVVSISEPEVPMATDAPLSNLGSLAARLGLSFWGHQAEHNDFIVVRREDLPTQGATR
jgi:hypothetical protein